MILSIENTDLLWQHSMFESRHSSKIINGCDISTGMTNTLKLAKKYKENNNNNKNLNALSMLWGNSKIE
jgi:hypothetical protein